MKREGVGLRAKLLVLLLAFGAIPLGVAITVGYTVSRSVITEQAESALSELTRRQAVHIATELGRERLLLRTIIGQLAPVGPLEEGRAGELSRLLAQSLPDDGVFDGLRLASWDGRVIASVTLRDVTPRWPAAVPAADWSQASVAIHRAEDEVVAYVIGVPLPGSDPAYWLEGHVRASDFTRLFTMPTHMIGDIESGIFDGSGVIVAAGHEHAAEALTRALAAAPAVPKGVLRAEVRGTRSLVALAPIEGTNWVFVAALPLEIALAPLARLRDAAVVVSIFLVVLILFVGAVAARSVTTPLRELAAAARRFGQGGVYKRVPRRSADEVGQLVESFNRMAQDIEVSREEIERLHERELERAQQLATVGELASAVAHEIRNPLTGVLGALQLAVRKLPHDDSSRPLLEEAQKQLERIETTTTRLLQYARPPELREVTVDANELVFRAMRVVDAQAKRAGIEFEAEPAPVSVPVHVDPEQIVQVLVNLMLNAIEAMGEGGRLTVWVSRHTPEVWIGVRDTGRGVPPEMRQQVFRPFFTTKHQGTGLGLSISQQIVTRHSGSIRVEDTPGGGATFVVALPLSEEEQS
jgi:signal transduction histidine kinase